MNHFSKLTLLFLAFLYVGCSTSRHQKDDYTAKIDSLLQTTTPHKFNGVIILSKKGAIKYAKAYGFTNFNQQTALNVNNRFEIMSNSKQFTSVLLLREVEKGTVNLQAPIKTYLPHLTPSWADSVTVHQLLNHTHGIIDTEKPLIFKPGSDYKYGNLSNILLGKIIEFASKKTYTEVAQELFEQQGMKNTFCYNKEALDKIVSGHLINNDQYTVVDSAFIDREEIPAAGIIATAIDLMTWNQKLHNGAILKPETYTLMTTESVKSQHNVFGKEKMGYGYNIRIAEENGIKYLGHTGLGDGFASLNIYIPKYDVSLIVLENQMNEDSDLYYFFEKKIKEIVLKSNLVQ